MRASSEQQETYYTPSSVPATPTGRQLTGARTVYDELADIKIQDREHLIVFDLDVRNRVIERRICAIGTLTDVNVHPREVFRPAIANGAVSIIMAHNHPSGDTSPSRADIELTDRIREAGELLGIRLLDHVVVASLGYVSLSERNWK